MLGTPFYKVQWHLVCADVVDDNLVAGGLVAGGLVADDLVADDLVDIYVSYFFLSN